MWQSPKCSQNNLDGSICVKCGYDESRDCGKYPSLVRLPPDEPTWTGTVSSDLLLDLAMIHGYDPFGGWRI